MTKHGLAAAALALGIFLVASSPFILLRSVHALRAAPLHMLIQAAKAYEIYEFEIRGRVANDLSSAPIHSVRVEARDVFDTLVDRAITDATGAYALNIGAAGGLYSLGFQRRGFNSGPNINNVSVGSANVDYTMAPLTPAMPHPPIAYSGPNDLYIEWFPAEVYNLAGYRLWRTETDADGASLGGPVQVGGLITVTEYEDPGTTAGVTTSTRWNR